MPATGPLLWASDSSVRCLLLTLGLVRLHHFGQEKALLSFNLQQLWSTCHHPTQPPHLRKQCDSPPVCSTQKPREPSSPSLTASPFPAASPNPCLQSIPQVSTTIHAPQHLASPSLQCPKFRRKAVNLQPCLLPAPLTLATHQSVSYRFLEQVHFRAFAHAVPSVC